MATPYEPAPAPALLATLVAAVPLLEVAVPEPDFDAPELVDAPEPVAEALVAPATAPAVMVTVTGCKYDE